MQHDCSHAVLSCAILSSAVLCSAVSARLLCVTVVRKEHGACRELAADLAQITFDFPFKIPPYFALIIRAISVLEGIALVGNPGTWPYLPLASY